MVSDAIAEITEPWQGLVYIDAPATRVGKGVMKGRAPKGHLVVELAGRPVSKEPVPKSERELGHDASGIERTVGAAQGILGVRDASPGRGRQWDLRIVVPGGAVDGGQLAVKSVADKNFEGLQWTVEGGADLGILDVEAEGGSMIAIGGGEVC